MQDVMPTYAKMIGRAWAEPEFARRLQEDPAAVMRESGLPVPADMKIPPGSFYIAPRPSDITVEALAGGPKKKKPVKGGYSCLGTGSCLSCPAGCVGTAGSFH